MPSVPPLLAEMTARLWVCGTDSCGLNKIQPYLPYTYLAMLTDAPLTIDLRQGSGPDTLIFVLNGPLTLRNMFELQSQLRNVAPARLTIFDLAGVPYMDSAGMGLVMNHYVHCQTRGSKLVVVAANSRVMDLFRVTKVETVLALAASIEEAEADA